MKYEKKIDIHYYIVVKLSFYFKSLSLFPLHNNLLTNRKQHCHSTLRPEIRRKLARSEIH